MSNFYGYALGASHATILRKAIQQNQAADRALSDLHAIMQQMLDGDGSEDGHYTTIQTRFGFDSVDVARAAYSEISAAFGKTSGNAQVDHVRDARDQLYARFTV